jgi:hypothetical protein
MGSASLDTLRPIIGNSAVGWCGSLSQFSRVMNGALMRGAGGDDAISSQEKAADQARCLPLRA